MPRIKVPTKLLYHPIWKEQTKDFTQEKYHLYTEMHTAALFIQAIWDAYSDPDQVSYSFLSFPNKNPYNPTQSNPLLPSTQLNSTQSLGPYTHTSLL